VGVDWASYAGSLAGVTVNLATGVGTGGDAEGDTLTGIENLQGSDHGDTLIGDAGANVLNGGNGDDLLIGGAGGDAINGGDGVDTASWASSLSGVSVDLAAGLASGGDADGDTLTGIENLVGSAHADVLAGDAGANTLLGGAGDDTLVATTGGDLLDGGEGSDTVSYAGATAAVTVDLSEIGVSLSGGAGIAGAMGELLVSIENIIGGSGNDTLTATPVRTASMAGRAATGWPEARETMSSPAVPAATFSSSARATRLRGLRRAPTSSPTSSAGWIRSCSSARSSTFSRLRFRPAATC